MSLLRKERLFTFAGILFALLIAIGGWELTSVLLDIQETSLLSKSGSVKVQMPTDTNMGMEGEANYPALTESEIYKILTVWWLDAEQYPHEPKAGQLSMEKAIAAGKSGLDFFSGQGILPKDFLTFDKTAATLCENKTDVSQLMPSNPNVLPDAVRSPKELDPFYSYWTVTFTSDKLVAVLTINAVTGQIWKAKMEYPVINSDLNKLDDTKIADAFMEYLKQKENALFGAEVQKNSTKMDENTSQLVLDIHLISK